MCFAAVQWEHRFTVTGPWGKSGLHTLLRLSVDKKNEGDGSFGVRFRKTLQARDEEQLSVLSRPLDTNEGAGVLTRVK
jgi:hypothetical protein